MRRRRLQHRHVPGSPDSRTTLLTIILLHGCNTPNVQTMPAVTFHLKLPGPSSTCQWAQSRRVQSPEQGGASARPLCSAVPTFPAAALLARLKDVDGVPENSKASDYTSDVRATSGGSPSGPAVELTRAMSIAITLPLNSPKGESTSTRGSIDHSATSPICSNVRACRLVASDLPSENGGV